MAKEVIMPKVDMDQETGTVVEWRKKNGEHVTAGEIILVIETDKVAVDVESPGTGILEGIAAQPGDVIPIGTVIAYLLSEGEDLPGRQTSASNLDQETPVLKEEKTFRQPATPLAKNVAAAHGIDLKTVVPSGIGAKITKADVVAKLQGEYSEKTDRKVYASPAARRTGRENQVDLTRVEGSGPKGRIQATDVLTFLERQDRTELPVEPQSIGPEVIPLIGIRRTIAERMTANYQNIPHIKFTSRVIMTEFAAARIKLNERATRCSCYSCPASIFK